MRHLRVMLVAVALVPSFLLTTKEARGFPITFDATALSALSFNIDSGAAGVVRTML